jgi:hypothetical protein
MVAVIIMDENTGYWEVLEVYSILLDGNWRLAYCFKNAFNTFAEAEEYVKYGKCGEEADD